MAVAGAGQEEIYPAASVEEATGEASPIIEAILNRDPAETYGEVSVKAILIDAEHLTIAACARIACADNSISRPIARDSHAVVDVEVAGRRVVLKPAAARDAQRRVYARAERNHVSSGV